MKPVKPLINQGWMRAILFALTYLVLIIFSNIVTDRLFGALVQGGSTGDDTVERSVVLLLTRVTVSLVVTVLSVYFFRKLIDKQDLISLGLHLKNNLSHAAAGFFLGLLLLGLGTFVLIANHNLQWTGINFSPGSLVTGIAVMIIVAFSEELVFRGYILQNLMSSMNKWLALVYTSLLFALFHLNNPGMNILSLINIFFAGLLLGVNYIFTKNLWFSIFFHFAWNFSQGSILGYKVSGVSLKSLFEQQLNGHPLITGGSFGFEGSLISGLLSLASIIVLGWVYRKKYEG
jgi:membrane protease YdiL (CAAX protease family)